ncbi:MAG: lipase, partial [Alphaproteobacteria bacterium]|nr:lipase [Alphaproteobacteria bacterium]
MQSYDICFIGDGFAEAQGDRTTRGWMGRLAEREGEAGHHLSVHRLGVVGQTSLDLSLG